MAKTDKPMTRVFKNWGEYLEVARTAPADPNPRKEWHGIDSYAQAMELADKGWSAGARKVVAKSLPRVESLSAKRESETAITWDVTGSDYDMGELLTGIPECWQSHTAPEQKPVVRIAMDTVCAGGIETRALEARGLALVSLVLALQTAGYAVDLALHCGMQPHDGARGGVNVWFKVPLIDPDGGPIDTDRLAFALIHSASTRAMAYAVGHSVANIDRYTGHISWPGVPDPWAADCDLYLRGLRLSDNWQSDESATAWVTEQFKRLTGPQVLGPKVNNMSE